MPCDGKGKQMIVEDLSPYDRATVGLWARSHRQVLIGAGGGWTAEAAAHAVLSRLRRCTERRQLFDRYETDAAADFALIRSVLPDEPPEEMLWRLRDAAFHLRWLELTGDR
jgi:hypothetical protein